MGSAFGMSASGKKCAADLDARVQDRIFPFSFHATLIGRLAVSHHHADLCTKMRFVVTECLGAIAGEIHISCQFHCFPFHCLHRTGWKRFNLSTGN